VYDALMGFEAECDELDDYLAGLTDEQWGHPSACPGWSVSDVVLHLAQSEEGVISSFDHDDAGIPLAPYFERASGEGDGAVDGIVAAAVEAERPDDPSDVLGRWRTANAGVRERFRGADPGRRLAWITVPLAARTLATTRMSEHWIHGMDIREPLGEPAADTGRLELIARLAWRTLPYAFESVGERAPTVLLRLDGPDGEVWELGEADAEVTVGGSAGEWCRLAARRLRPGETSLRAEGPGAARVLELVRTYA
jgi:uncharacterized protein (TIGR03084 family)